MKLRLYYLIKQKTAIWPSYSTYDFKVKYFLNSKTENTYFKLLMGQDQSIIL